MRYFTDTTQAEQLNLSGTTLMVFSTLQCLCAHKPWELSPNKLAEYSRCGSHQTASRAVQTLVQNGLVVVQNGLISVQNGLNPKEKKYQERENINKENKIKQQCGSVNARESEPSPTQKEKVMLQILGIKDKVPGSTGLYKEVIRFGYLQPKQYINAMYDHYDKFGRKVVNPLAAIRDWIRREKKAPALNEQEIAYLSTFLDAIEQRAVVRICDLLTCFELTDKYAIFTMKLTPDKIQAMDEWIATHILYEFLEPYNRAITYKVAQ